ncbi:MAG: FHA domain-containing protein, partial [Myxococcota bacterium]
MAQNPPERPLGTVSNADVELLDESDLIPESPPIKKGPPPPKPRPQNVPPTAAPQKAAPPPLQEGGADDPFGAAVPSSGVRLVVVDGANKGDEYSIDRDVISIGRGAENDIVLKDVSVSRKHSQIIKEGGDYRVVDLGSGNGTFMGGNRITEEKLISGMVFKLGATVIRFVKIGDVYSTNEELARLETVPIGFTSARPQSARPPVQKGGDSEQAGGRTKQVLFFGTVTLVLFVALMLLVKFFVLDPAGGGGTQAVAPQPVQQKPDTQQLFADGVDAFKRKDWESASATFRALLTIDPANEKARQYRQKIDDEMAARRKLAEAR